MFKVVEITKGTEPKGNVLKFGSTPASDFFIVTEPTKYFWDSEVDRFLNEMEKTIKRSCFEFTKEFKEFNSKYFFNKII